ncbi:hypothetical protein HPB49_017309 [Dermacentor silvarum]|uniref:Uncharacterized protein n=1 Tax=Dermacentor silvarum TaxID=543639 RepID=A0ACB8D783_DERSI|nr:hypothetical protein HPB49_017309 [Dermacentor silvarum]
MHLVWTVLCLQVCAVLGLVLGADEVQLDPSMPNVCAYRKSETVRVSKPSRRARTQMVKIRIANCSHAQAECFEYQPRTVHYVAYEDRLERRYTTAYRCCEGWTRRIGERGCLHRSLAYADAAQCLNGGRSRRHSRQFGEPHCICPPGYQGPRCESDVDECLAENRCTHDCVNTFGSYRCSCHPGYQLAGDGASCFRIDVQEIHECGIDNAGCEHNCRVTRSGPECSCRDGYRLLSDKKSCEDIDECLEQPDRCEHRCQNLDGSFRCTCPSGLQLAEDGRTCKLTRRFGDRCDRLCPDDCPSGRCHRRFGYCECPPASHGRFCNLPCAPFTHGPSCSRMCKCDRANTLRCDPVSGECVCREGFTGGKCKHRCPKGTWGALCAHKCNCSSCDPITGGCNPAAADCEQSGDCSQGKWLCYIYIDRVYSPGSRENL